VVGPTGPEGWRAASRRRVFLPARGGPHGPPLGLAGGGVPGGGTLLQHDRLGARHRDVARSGHGGGAGGWGEAQGG